MGESTLLVLPITSSGAGGGISEIEKAADDLAETLASGKSLPRVG
jgi:hypothetical protein